MKYKDEKILLPIQSATVKNSSMFLFRQSMTPLLQSHSLQIMSVPTMGGSVTGAGALVGATLTETASGAGKITY